MSLKKLQDKKCHDKLADKYEDLFKEISDKAMSCNNVATLQNIKVEAGALKVRCLNEIEKEEAKIMQQNSLLTLQKLVTMVKKQVLHLHLLQR